MSATTISTRAGFAFVIMQRRYGRRRTGVVNGSDTRSRQEVEPPAVLAFEGAVLRHDPGFVVGAERHPVPTSSKSPPPVPRSTSSPVHDVARSEIHPAGSGTRVPRLEQVRRITNSGKAGV